MFLDFYRLCEQPFGVTPNPRYLYHSPAHREALASLIYGIEAGLGFAALIAEPGMGKTTLLFYLLEKFRSTSRTALIFQTQCTRLELLRYIARELELPGDESDPVVLNERILDLLVQEARAGRRVIVILDEAQNLSEDALESVRLLSDYETADSKLLHIILAGQPELAQKLARPNMAQLLQRISMLNRLKPLNPQDIRNYVEYRLSVAGHRGPMLFTPEAINLIASLTGGVPRNINRVCFNALSLGCALKRRVIGPDVIEEVGADLDIGELIHGRGVKTVDGPVPDRTTDKITVDKSKLARSQTDDTEIAAAAAEHGNDQSAPAAQTRTSVPTGQAALATRMSAEAAPAETSSSAAVPRTSPGKQDQTLQSRLDTERGGAARYGKGRRLVVVVSALATVVLLSGWGLRALPGHNGAASELKPRLETAQPMSGDQISTEFVESNPAVAPTSAPNAVVPAVLRKRVEPVYPPAAQRAGIQGTVVVTAVIAKDGRPRSVKAVSGNPLLAQSAVDAVRKWVYRPYLLNGQPTDVGTQVVIVFDLASQNQ